MNRIDLLRPDAPDLARRGAHPVGVQTQTLTHRAQPDVFGPAGGVADRRLVVEYWYPAVAGAGHRLGSGACHMGDRDDRCHRCGQGDAAHRGHHDPGRQQRDLLRQAHRQRCGQTGLVDAVPDHGDDLAGLLGSDKTHVYVCGLKGMEEGVFSALADICSAHGLDWQALSGEMRAQGRYHVETY